MSKRDPKANSNNNNSSSENNNSSNQSRSASWQRAEAIIPQTVSHQAVSLSFPIFFPLSLSLLLPLFVLPLLFRSVSIFPPALIVSTRFVSLALVLNRNVIQTQRSLLLSSSSPLWLSLSLSPVVIDTPFPGDCNMQIAILFKTIVSLSVTVHTNFIHIALLFSLFPFVFFNLLFCFAFFG